MRVCLVCVCTAFSLVCAGLGQQPAEEKPVIPGPPETAQPSISPAEAALKNMFESKVKIEWEALKKKDQKAYGELLADDYEGVEADGGGERTKIQSINEVLRGNVFDYTLWGFKTISLTPDTAFFVYEVTMHFPPRSVVRYSRVYISEFWVKRQGEWKELHYQETHVR